MKEIQELEKGNIQPYIFYWLDGNAERLFGENATDALNKAGYGQGALRALDFHSVGPNVDYEWINKRWEPIKKEGKQ